MEITEYLIIALWGMMIGLLLIRGYHRRAPQQQMGLEIGACMTIGNREVQEDCFATVETQAGVLAVLSDGMGKAYGGRLASRAATEAFKEIFQDYNVFDNPLYFFRKAFNGANRAILNLLDNGHSGAASVGAAAILQNKLYYAVAGNVKICVYRAGEIVPMSIGHTVDRLAERGFQSGKISREAAIALLEDRRLYNFVGRDEFQDVEYYDAPITLKREDVVVLMSDGVFEPLSWKEIEGILATKRDCRTMAFEIIQRINELEDEDKDNASLVLIRV